MLDNLETILLQTLEDHRLSRGERKALGQLLREEQPSEDALAYARHRAFELARGELSRPGAGSGEGRRVLDWLEEVTKTFAAYRRRALAPTRLAEAFFSPGRECLARIRSLLASARRSVDVCVFTVTDDRITERLLETHRRGVAVRLITDAHKTWDPGSDVERLEVAGVSVVQELETSHMHHKFAVFDGEILLTGSYNWTRSAAESNQENLVVTDDRRLVGSFTEHFEELWERFGGASAVGG